MPDPREIERLKKTLRAIAQEDEVLASRGETYRDLPPPPESESRPAFPTEDIENHVAESFGLESSSGTEVPFASPGADEPVPDFSSLLQDMDFSLPEQGEDAAGEGAAEEGAAELPAFDLGAFAAQNEYFSIGEEASPGAPNEAESETEVLPEVETLPEAELGSKEESLPTLNPFETEPPSAGAPIPQETEVPEELFADEGLGQADLSAKRGDEQGFEMPAMPSEAPAEASSEASGESGGFDIPNFDLGDLGGDADLGGDVALGGDAALGEETASEALPAADEDGLGSGEAEAAPAGFDAGIQARADFGIKGPKGEEDPFASFNFDDGGIMGSVPSMESIDSELASLDETPQVKDSFGLDAFWGGAETVRPSASFGPKAPSKGAEEFAAPGVEAGEISLTEKEVDRLQDSLLSYPLNLRLEIEQCIANDVLPPGQTAELIDAMVRGKGAEETANLLGRFLGKRIRIPKGFERKTGEQFEAERGTFWYAFKTNILPLAGISLAVAAALAMFVFLGYNLVWKPLYADSIYRSGYKLIPEGDYKQSELLFDAAVKVRRVRSWYFRYAESYIAHKQYILAAKKYDELLYERYPNGAINYNRYKKDKKAALDYARFESTVLLAFEKAENLLKTTLLDWRPNDEDGLLLLGDNSLAWADDAREQSVRDEKLESARKSFAGLIRLYGRKDIYLGRMLVYFMRTGKMKEVIPLKDYFLSKKKPVIDSAIYAELGAYLIDANNLEQVRSILLLGVKKDPAMPDNHYQLARYCRATNNPEEERKALSNAVRGFEAMPSLTRARLMAYIDSLNWSGESRYAAKEYLDAEVFFEKAIKEYENALIERRIEASGRFGVIYANRADIYYYDRIQYETAFKLYEDADRNLYSTPDTAYKRGFIRYRNAAYKDALGFFYRASGDFTSSDNLSLSLANTLYYREDYSAASGYYLQLRNAMRDEIARIEYQDPQDRPDQSRIVRLLMTASNNLGVSLYHLANRGGDASRRAEAMASFTESIQLYDVMNRDQSTMLRPEGANLAFLNLDGILHPSRAFVPQIYPDISKDLVDSDEKIAVDAALYAGKKR